MDGQLLQAMRTDVEENLPNLESLLVIRHGYLVSESYWGFSGQETTHELFSVTKSFVATLVGIAIDQGYIGSVDLPAVSLLPPAEYANPDPAKDQMTLENLLTMTAGLGWVEGDAGYLALSTQADWARYMLDLPITDPPGSRFLYCSGCSHVLSAIIQNQTGQNTLDFAAANLFEPLGITQFSWRTSSNGIPIGGWGLQLTPRDMAKLGYLYLHEGQWDGQQVISASYISAATRKHIPADYELDYGYQWWINPRLNAYIALGRAGQTILVAPAEDVIVVTTASGVDHDEIFRLVEEYILPAVLEP